MSLIKLVTLPSLGDERGGLVSIEASRHVAFDIKRVYYIFETKDKTSRGFHAHRALKQLVVCVAGSCRMLLDNGREKKTVLLDSPKQGLIIESMVWREMHDFSPDCVLLVLASEHCDESDYIRDYRDFVSCVNNGE